MKIQKNCWQTLEKTGKYGYLRVFSINTAHGQSQLSQEKVRGLHTNIPLTQDKSKFLLKIFWWDNNPEQKSLIQIRNSSLLFYPLTFQQKPDNATIVIEVEII